MAGFEGRSWTRGEFSQLLRPDGDVVGLAANADTGQVAISNGGQAGEGCGGSKASPSGRRVCPALARQH